MLLFATGFLLTPLVCGVERIGFAEPGGRILILEFANPRLQFDKLPIPVRQLPFEFRKLPLLLSNQRQQFLLRQCA